MEVDFLKILYFDDLQLDFSINHIFQNLLILWIPFD
jgi:hypothetical protein